MLFLCLLSVLHQNVSRDLVKLVGSIGFSSTDSHHNYSSFSAGDQPSSGEVLAISNVRTASKDELGQNSVAIIKAVLTAGLYPQVCLLKHHSCYKPSCFTF